MKNILTTTILAIALLLIVPIGINNFKVTAYKAISKSTDIPGAVYLNSQSRIQGTYGNGNHCDIELVSSYSSAELPSTFEKMATLTASNELPVTRQYFANINNKLFYIYEGKTYELVKEGSHYYAHLPEIDITIEYYKYTLLQQAITPTTNFLIYQHTQDMNSIPSKFDIRCG